MMPVTSGFDWRESSYNSSRDGNYAETALSWRKSSYSGGQGGNCVEVADTPDLYAVRDSKTPAQTPLAFDRTEWQAFLRTTRNDRL